MRYDITGAIKDYRDRDIMLSPSNPKETPKPVSWYNLIYAAFHSQAFPITAPEEKQMAFKITQRAAVRPQEFVLTADDLAFLMKRIELVHDPLVLGRAKQLFEGWEDKELEDKPAKIPRKQ